MCRCVRLFLVAVLTWAFMGASVTEEIGRIQAAGPAYGAWSPGVNEVAGRLVVARPVIGKSDFFEVGLELRNLGGDSLLVLTGDLYGFRPVVVDGEGKDLPATHFIYDLYRVPAQWGVIPPRAYLGFEVSTERGGDPAASQLEIGFLIWKLSPGKYKLQGTCRSVGARPPTERPLAFPEEIFRERQPRFWIGEIDLPPVEIEVLDR